MASGEQSAIAVGTAHLDEVVAITQNNALARAGECLGNHELLALFNDVDRAGIFVADSGENILILVEGELFVNLITSMQFVVQVSGFGEQRLHTNHLGVSTQRSVVTRETGASKTIARTQVPALRRQNHLQL
jgi:hypothetical protein